MMYATSFTKKYSSVYSLCDGLSGQLLFVDHQASTQTLCLNTKNDIESNLYLFNEKVQQLRKVNLVG